MKKEENQKSSASAGCTPFRARQDNPGGTRTRGSPRLEWRRRGVLPSGPSSPPGVQAKASARGTSRLRGTTATTERRLPPCLLPRRPAARLRTRRQSNSLRRGCRVLDINSPSPRRAPSRRRSCSAAAGTEASGRRVPQLPPVRRPGRCCLFGARAVPCSHAPPYPHAAATPRAARRTTLPLLLHEYRIYVSVSTQGVHCRMPRHAAPRRKPHRAARQSRGERVFLALPCSGPVCSVWSLRRARLVPRARVYVSISVSAFSR